MATIKSNKALVTNHFTFTAPYGNTTTLGYNLKTNDTGVVEGGDADTAPQVGDVIDLGLLPEGWCLADAQVFVTVGMSDTVTGSLGFAYEDGEDDTDVPQDDEYFVAAGADLATAGRLRADGSKLVVLPKPARLILTLAGAANAKASDITVTVSGELTGYN
ncbi:hypothetical protein [Psychrobacter sp. AOP7-B1-24]|uniref:hypothetical protein n=1 Tax=Psychrobacter sp. AOP7-B1-24 TaxID=3457645 RepID=UPI00402B7183